MTTNLRFGVWYRWTSQISGHKVRKEQGFGYGDMDTVAGTIRTALERHPEREVFVRQLDEGQVIETTPLTPQVHVEDLFAAVHKCSNDMSRAVMCREYSKVQVARAEFQAWCEAHGLTLDFTPR